MEDVRVKGFAMWPKDNAISLDHCRAVIDVLARFHAVSFALKDQRPEVFHKFKALKDLQQTLYSKPSSITLLRGVYKDVLSFLPDGKQIEIIRDIKDNFTDYLSCCLDEKLNDRCSVITHGDCWIKNVLFKFNNGVSNLYFSTYSGFYHF